ncbi:MAG TPA: endonuclease/exonuclease/phosphatase family protein [Jiangellaceae bacterium]|nr:endonuclease/exonuclease/phosphatase family protein [Jiangellaceae bacterium]
MARLRFGTFNLLYGRSVQTGVADEADLRSAAAALDADVLGLQEVDRSQPRSAKVDQAAVVADELNAPWWRFVPMLTGIPPTWASAESLDDSAVSAHGVALVSRLRVLHWDVRRFSPASVSLPLRVAGRRGLTRVPDQPRAAIAAVVVGPDGPFTVATAHLSFVPGRNAQQLRAIVRWLATMPSPRFLAGDLNLPGRVPGSLTGWVDLARAPTYPSWRPRVQWDHILSSGVGLGIVRAATSMRLPVSDHCALVVDLQV